MSLSRTYPQFPVHKFGVELIFEFRDYTRVMEFLRYLALLLLSVGCLGASAPDWQTRQPSSLLPAQVAKADSLAQHRRLFYVGLALYPEQWSQNDVVDLSEALRKTTSFEVVPLIASNMRAGSPGTYPVADDAAIAGLIRTASARAGPDDIVFVHISTHGGAGVLARKIAGGPDTALTARQLASELSALGAHRTVIVISACYSGSLIGAVRSPARIVITAARADRSSFGCAASSRHTFFGEAELRGFGKHGRSRHQVVAVIRDDVATMEHARRYTRSLPQVSVGARVTDLYESPMF